MPWEGIRIIIAERMKWTLEYVDNLPMADIMQLLAVWRGQEVAKR